MITIAVANQKGGVGKTTISYNLAQTLAMNNRRRVLTIDNDPQGNLTSSFLENLEQMTANILEAYDGNAVEPMQISKNLYLFGSNISLAPVAERDFQVVFKLKETLERLQNQFDFAIVDCMPSFGHLHLAALNAANCVLIPVKPAPYALAGMKDLISTIRQAKKYFNPKLMILGILINQVDGRKPIMEREMEKVLRETYKDMVLKSRINKRIRVEESPAFHEAIIAYDPNGPASKEFKAVTRELLRRISLMQKGGR
jgi:chromosome partitioning protein